ncbi:MAG TPA: BACON domain-containing protein [Cyclobacteriaceae bacterium]|nr:BACON domain-containing protein [Cyclobacteriaceae bacterium]
MFGCEVFRDSFLRTSESKLFIDSMAGSKEFTITSNDNWEISCQEDWLSFSLAHGRGKQTITINWKANPKNNIRIGSFDVVYSDGRSQVTVEQEISPIQMVNYCGQLGNKTFGITDSIRVIFDRPVTVERIYSPWISCVPPTIEYSYTHNRHGVSFTYSCARLGGSYPFEVDVVDDEGNKLSTAFDIGFYQKQVRIDGFITSYFVEEENGLYWLSTTNPNSILALSMGDLSIVRKIDLDILPSRIRLNPFNGKMYILNFNRDSNIYVLDILNGQIVKTIPNLPFGDDHPQYPAIYPSDIDFLSDGYGVVVLKAEGATMFRWKIIDSANDDEMFLHPQNDGINGTRFNFTGLTSNFDKTKILLMNVGVDADVGVLDQQTKEITITRPLEGSTRILSIKANRLNSSLFLAHSWHQYVAQDIPGIISKFLFRFYYSDWSNDFDYYPNNGKMIYYLGSGEMALFDFNSQQVLSWYDALHDMKGLTATTDGKHLITYKHESSTDQSKSSSLLYQFSAQSIRGW